MPAPSPERGFATPADLAACREAIRTGSRTFFAASLLLPEKVRQPALALYAFCRQADDAVDQVGRREDALDSLSERLDRIYAARPLPQPVDRALADVVERFPLPRALLDALLEGFAWDAAGRRYEDLAAVRAYAARVAGAVGAMMAVLMGIRAPAVVARACDLGVAMQLSNIARDVGEDARAGRLYLPLQWLREEGIDPDRWLAAPDFNVGLGRIVERLLRAADLLYARADVGIARLPLGCRPGIRAARLLYAGIGHEVERQGLDSVSRRAVVPRARKARLFAQVMVPTGVGPADIDLEPLPEVGFLVDAVAMAPQPRAAQTAADWWNVGDRATWVLDLFERVERRRQLDGA